MATLFASDLHLDSEAPWAIDAFLGFLTGPARSAEALFLLGDGFARRAGVKLLPDPVLVDLYGVPTLLSHGDVFCTEDPAYQQLRSVVRQTSWQQRFLSLP